MIVHDEYVVCMCVWIMCDVMWYVCALCVVYVMCMWFVVCMCFVYLSAICVVCLRCICVVCGICVTCVLYVMNVPFHLYGSEVIIGTEEKRPTIITKDAPLALINQEIPRVLEP